MFKTLVFRPLKVWEFGNTYLGTAKGDMLYKCYIIVYECSICKGTSSLICSQFKMQKTIVLLQREKLNQVIKQKSEYMFTVNHSDFMIGEFTTKCIH